MTFSINLSVDFLTNKKYVKLKPNAKFILILMMIEAKNKKNDFEFSFRNISKLTEMSMNTINKAIKELIKYQFIDKTTNGQFGMFPSKYKIILTDDLWNVDVPKSYSIFK